MNKKILLLVLVSGLLQANIIAQPANWAHYTSANGLASNWVYGIAIDRYGNHWFGTYAGMVSKYNTQDWSSHDIRHKQEPAYGGYSIAIDKAGDIWFGTPYGVNHYNGNQWASYDTTDGLAHNSVRSILVDNAGNRWFATLGGINRYNGSYWQTYTMSNGLPDNQVFTLAEDTGGIIWAGSVKGISKFNGSQWEVQEGPLWVHSLAFDQQNNLWAGYRGGLAKYDGQTWKKYVGTLPDSSDRFGSVRTVAADLVGNVWLGASRTIWNPDPVNWNGALKFDGTNWTYYDSSNGLPNNFVRTIVVDHFNNKWFGTDGGAAHFAESATGIYLPQVPSLSLSPFPLQNQVRIRLPAHFTRPGQLKILDMQGRLVAGLGFDEKEKCFVWDGTDASGLQTPAGTYFYRVLVDDRAVCGKILKIE